nr:MAG TPA: hypothetical protein [Caudoviricetes sp.]
MIFNSHTLHIYVTSSLLWYVFLTFDISYYSAYTNYCQH